MAVVKAQKGGFCFGVRRAVDAVFQCADGKTPVYTWGPIIHNTQVVDRLESKDFLRRAEGSQDRRQVRLFLSREGEGLARKLEALQVKGLGRVLKRLTAADRKDVIRGIERLVSAARGEV